jgi:antitoxin (DNA-binding transcriptional repressor) of toxin-antitoxin stability system
MIKATMFEAKTNLSKLVERALKGEEVLITSGREKKPVVRLAPVEAPSTNRRLGFLKGQGHVGPEFFEPLPEEELRLWNGEGK